MATFLLIGGRFDLDVGANSICIRNIALELKKHGHNVLAITNSWNKDLYHEINGVKVWGLKESVYDFFERHLKKKHLLLKYIFKIISIIRHVVLVPFYPNVAFIRCLRIIKLAKKIIQEYKVDCVICFYRPIESLFCGLNLKRLYGANIQVFDFHLDLLKSETKVMFNSFFQKQHDIFLKKEYESIDCMFLPESEMSERQNDKVVYTGFPVCILDEQSASFDAMFSKDFINCVYVGSLDCSNRNPLYAIELMELFNARSSKKMLLHVWGFVDDQTKEIINRYNFVKYNGLLDNSYSQSVLGQSDFVLNIGNKNTYSMLPSKIFKSFLSGKPIFNFVKNKKDISLRYFRDYGFALNLFENDSDKDVHFRLFNQFVMLNKGKVIDVPHALIEKNTPSYIVDKIEERFNAGNEK